MDHRRNSKGKAKEYKGRDFETVYEISQQIPQNTEQWKIAGLHIQDELADCFELKSAKLLDERMCWLHLELLEEQMETGN